MKAITVSTPTFNYKISVIMGIYNCENTLGIALNSLLGQTYKNFKVIMCDDGSSDNTYAIAKSYSEKFNNFILIKNDKNLGLNATLNHCLRYADTQYVARMDGDDISMPERFEKELEFLEKNQHFMIVSTNMVYFDESGDFRTSECIEYPQPIDFISGTPFCHAPSMMRRKALEVVGGYSECKRLLRVEDYHLWFKMYEKGFRGYNIQEPLYKMRDDRNAIRRRKFKYRVNEAYVRFIGFKMLNLPFCYLVFAIKPIIIGLLPKFVYMYLRNCSVKKIRLA